MRRCVFRLVVAFGTTGQRVQNVAQSSSLLAPRADVPLNPDVVQLILPSRRRLVTVVLFVKRERRGDCRGARAPESKEGAHTLESFAHLQAGERAAHVRQQRHAGAQGLLLSVRARIFRHSKHLHLHDAVCVHVCSVRTLDGRRRRRRWRRCRRRALLLGDRKVGQRTLAATVASIRRGLSARQRAQRVGRFENCAAQSPIARGSQ